MRYAVISDIHGNLPALQAVLQDAQACGAQGYLILGDDISDFPWLDQIHDTLRALPGMRAVRGNREDALLSLAREDPAAFVHRQYAAGYWNARHVSDGALAYMESLPQTFSFTEQGARVHMAHKPQTLFGASDVERLAGIYFDDFAASTGSADHAAYLAHARDVVRRDPALRALPPGIYLFGHYHAQWYAEADGRLLINPGSCGLPVDHDNRAAYTLLTLENGQAHVLERRVAYDVERAIHALRSSTLFEAAPVWCEVVILQLRTGREWLRPLFDDLEARAQRAGVSAHPFPDALWEEGGRRFLAAQAKPLAD